MLGKQAAPGRPWNMQSSAESSLAACFTLCLYSLKLWKLLLSPTPCGLGRYLSQLLLLCIAEVCRASGLPVAWIQGGPASQPPSQPCKSRACGGRGGQSNPCALGSRSTKPTWCSLYTQSFPLLCSCYYYLSLLLIGEKCSPAARRRDLRAPAGWSAWCHLANQPLCWLWRVLFISHARSEPPAVAHATAADK